MENEDGGDQGPHLLAVPSSVPEWPKFSFWPLSWRPDLALQGHKTNQRGGCLEPANQSVRLRAI
ncbi:hypothetical protein EYF80_042631 [Liparis tanakae]|uniref:Uncharacterized protein n=1 Tax=Liparis tanakae TaxID=230148 RepID=A0A4Z2G0Z2_9TELE|nr:hypothetical protein EYF80_042631 [Liparis tanakae]